MNIPVLIVACIMALACAAHVIGGTRETARLAPAADAPKLTRHWVQAMCAFQMLSVDLIVVTALLFGIALWDLGAAEPVLHICLIALFVFWGCVWVIQTLALKRAEAGLQHLPHWAVWFFCAGLLWLGL